VLTLPMPALRERREDIDLLARHFLQTAGRDFGRTVTDFEADALAALRQHSWPGNVREMIAMIRRAVVIGDGDTVLLQDLIGLEDTPRHATPLPHAHHAAPVAKPSPRAGSTEERAALVAALERYNENVTLTAQELGVSRVTLYRMLRRHAIALDRGLKEPPITRSSAGGEPAYRLDAVVG